MVKLRADAWDPSYGRGFEALEEASETAVDTSVETGWDQPLPGSADPSMLTSLVDGTMRLEMRLVASEGLLRAPGLIGSVAAGSCEVGPRSGFGAIEVRRLAITGADLRVPGFDLEVGGSILSFEPVSTPGNDDLAVMNALRDAMTDLEVSVATTLASDPDRLVIVDGPLRFTTPTQAPIVGLIKRAVRRYLPDAEEALLPRLDPGQRTPLFALGDPQAGSHRYSWYSRIGIPRIGQHELSGLVRCEVAAALGLPEARRLADLVAGNLPRLGGRPDDPRTPQNLLPVSGLERKLRHHLGDRALVARACSRWITQIARQEATV
ncbi:MAG: hypothetical protein ACLGH3_01670 [Actinomycetota bacterium]